MEGLTRISISLESALLDAFDRTITAQGYATRSEAIRDLIRDRLVRGEQEQSDDARQESVLDGTDPVVQRFDVVTVEDRDGLLRHDRPAIERGVDEVHGTAGESRAWCSAHRPWCPFVRPDPGSSDRRRPVREWVCRQRHGVL